MTLQIFNRNNNLTPYQDINEVLLVLTSGIQDILAKKLVGLYLFGSLTYGDFNPESSDIDLVTIINKPLNQYELDLIKQLHKQIAEKYPKWSHRLECSYTPIDLLKNTLPPKEPRPYYGGGIFYDEAPYGNEWIINNYLLYNHGVTLIGSDFKKLIKPIDIIEVQKACIKDLFQEWEPKITDFEWLDNSHYQSYLVLNLCRILYTVFCATTGTKKVSAEWVKKQYDMPWRNLIEAAESWGYGKEMHMRNQSIDFIKFVIAIIKKTLLYQEMYSNNSPYNITRISDFLNGVIAWAKQNPEIKGIALVGSYARNQARDDSDIDLVILTNNPNNYTSTGEWLKQFGNLETKRLENYGAVTSWHVHYKNSHEVEFGIALPSWADLPVEKGTKEVISDGIIILYDPEGLFERLITKSLLYCSDFQLLLCASDATRDQMHEIRKTVLFLDRKYDRNHPDDRNPDNHCFIFLFKNIAVGTVRLDFLSDKVAAIRLVAILPEYQGKKFGAKMLEAIEEYAKQHGVHKLVTNAAVDARGFYESTGYDYEEWIDPGEGISKPTIPMIKTIAK